jgi:GAF domain-containing protein
MMTIDGDVDAGAGALSLTATLASQTYKTNEDAVNAVLDVAQQITGFETVLISEISTARSELRIHAVENTQPGLTVPAGLTIPLTASPCQHVANSVSPFVSTDMHADAELAVLPAAKDMGATSYIGVPVVLADGSFFGTLVGLDTAAHERSQQTVEWMQILAQLAARHLERVGASVND